MTIGELKKLIRDLSPDRKITVKKYYDTGNKQNEVVALHLTEEVFVVLEVEKE